MAKTARRPTSAEATEAMGAFASVTTPHGSAKTATVQK
jgi:hypothetical protein